MKRKIGFLGVFSFLLSLIISVSVFSSVNVYADNDVYLGGMPAGFSLSTNGAYVVGVCDVVTADGIVSPSKDAGIKVGDVILSIDGKNISNAENVEREISGKSIVVLEILHLDSSVSLYNVKLAKDLSGINKLGVFIRDDVCGIGTVTYVKNNRFASLGHPVVSEDGKILEITGGSVFDCNITGFVKGEKGKAGELRGVFLKTNAIANIEKNLTCGVYGKTTDVFDKTKLQKIEVGEAMPGNAEIFTTIEGSTPKQYNISIIKVDYFGENKNFVVKITDKELLENTGGIVQGMSGSPIVQNNKLVGAVTHVFINDPTRGFGISISNMINN